VSIADELTKLDALRRSDALTDAEFQEAKRALLGRLADAPSAAEPSAAAPPADAQALADQSLGLAANRYVDVQNRKVDLATSNSRNSGILAGLFLIIFLVVAVTIMMAASGTGDSGPDPKGEMECDFQVRTTCTFP
jgi:zona occludens toxin (predicted ATPase)